MNCRAAQRLISAERDRALRVDEQASLEAHTAGCVACRQARQDLAAAAVEWRKVHQAARVPDVESAWLDIRREIRRGGGSQAQGGRPTVWWGRALWAGLPTAAAAALVALVFLNRPAPSGDSALGDRVVEVEESGTTPVVIFDEVSGVVVVWAGTVDGSQS